MARSPRYTDEMLLAELRASAKRLGRSYLVVTDHSHYLREGRMEAQNREIDKVQQKLGRFKLLKGVEANIRANGEVDVAEDVLAERDWVMASIHSGFDKDLTERVLAAMDNPHVDCIGHLTGRKLNRRGPRSERMLGELGNGRKQPGLSAARTLRSNLLIGRSYFVPLLASAR